MKNELRKSLYELDRASYLESAGMVKEAREHSRQSFDTVMNLRNQIADDHNKLETTEYTRKIGAAETKLKQKTDIEEKRIARAGAGNSKDEQLYLRSVQGAETLRNQFEKRYQTEIERLRQESNLPETSPFQKKAVERLKEIDKERDKLEERIAREYPRVPSLKSNEPVAPSAGSITAGQVVDGYKFKGGDPNSKNNWEKVK